jgi:hypothetical protein
MSKIEFLLTANDKASAAFAKVRGELSAMSATASKVSSTFAAIGGALGAGLSVGAITTWLRSTINGLDALNDLADATGESVEKLSALEDVALRTGTSMDTASAAVIKLNKALIEGSRDGDSEAARAVKNLGLNIKDLMALSPVERLQAVGKALNSFEGENKLEYTLALLGKSTREVAPLLKDLAEAGELNATVTKEQADQAERFNKELFAMEKNVLDLSRAFAGPLAARFNETIKILKEGTKEAKGFWETLLAIQRTVGKEQLKALGLGGQEGGATGSWGDPEEPKKGTLKPLGGDPKKGLAEAKRLAAERLKLAEFAAQQLVTLEEITAQETAEAWKFYNEGRAKQDMERAEAYQLQMKQVWEFDEQQRQEEIDQWAVVLQGIKKEGSTVAADLALVFSSAAGEAIANFKSLRDVLKGVLADIAQIAIRETVTKPLAALATTFFSGLSFRAAGGPVSSGMPYIVGERGPELFVPSSSGRVMANGAGGGMVLQTTIHIDSRTDQAQVAQLVAGAMQQTEKRMWTSMRARGVA